MSTDTRLGADGPPRRRIGEPSPVLGIGLLAIAVLVVWVVARGGEHRSVTADAPVAQAEPTGATEPPSEAPAPAAEPAADIGPLTAADLGSLVLEPEEGTGLVKGLAYSPGYSGSADLADVHHWTLVPTEPLEAAGFVEGYSSIFMTSAFASTFAAEGRDLLTAALLFETLEGARRAQRVFIDTRPEVWEEVRTLPRHGDGWVIGRLGSDNVSVTYPTVGFLGRVKNIVLVLGSQGGWKQDQPLPVPVVRSIARDLLTRARVALEEAA